MPFTIRLLRHGPKLTLAYFSCFWSLITFLVLSSGVPALAEWVLVSVSDPGMTTYVDQDTIRRKGDLVKMWSLGDYKAIQTEEGISFLSIKVQGQYNCATELDRGLSLTIFSGHMGGGDVVYSGANEQKWKPIIPGSVGQTLWKFACGKK